MYVWANIFFVIKRSEENFENAQLNIEGEKSEVSYEDDSNDEKNCCTSLITKNASDNDKRAGSSIFDTYNTSNMDDDIQKMYSSLEESSKFFRNIGERFENINFSRLKSNIKDLHLNERSNSDVIKVVVDDLKNSFDEKFKQNRLEDLTKEVTTKFREHPGEFGNIPELSEFFKTCAQLQQGLEKLQKIKDNCQNLERRMFRAAEASYDRVSDIQSKITKGGKQEETMPDDI